MTLLVAGDGGRPMAERVAEITRWQVAATEFKAFPDGEEYARILQPVQGRDVVIVQTGWPTTRLWKLLMLLNAARENGARSIRCLVPYFPYARQDRVFQEGEPVTARLVMELLRTHAKQVVTVELHKAEVASFFGPGCADLSAVEPFAADFRRRGIDVVLAPDAGARTRAEAVAARMGAKVDHLEKKRISGDTVEIKPKSLDVRGKRVAILDDIISTGGTMAKATEQLIRNGAASVLCAGVHGLFIGDAVSKLKAAGATQIVSTDTIESPYSHVTVAPLLVDALSKPVVR